MACHLGAERKTYPAPPPADFSCCGRVASCSHSSLKSVVVEGGAATRCEPANQRVRTSYTTYVDRMPGSHHHTRMEITPRWTHNPHFPASQHTAIWRHHIAIPPLPTIQETLTICSGRGELDQQARPVLQPRGSHGRAAVQRLAQRAIIPHAHMLDAMLKRCPGGFQLT